MAEIIESVKLNDPKDLRPTEASRQDNNSQTFSDYLEKEKQKIRTTPSLAIISQLYSEILNSIQLGDSNTRVENTQRSNQTAEAKKDTQAAGLHQAADNQTANTVSASQSAAKENTQISNAELKQLIEQYFPNLSVLSPQNYFESLNSMLGQNKSVSLSSLVDEIVKQISMVKDRGKTELSMTLEPENLGSLLLTITSVEGKLSVQITGSAEAKKFLDDNLSQLQNAFQNAHLSVGNLNVSVGNFREENKPSGNDKDFNLSYSLFSENMVQQSQINPPESSISGSMYWVDENSTLNLKV